MTRNRVACVAAGIAVMAAPLGAAELPYAGRWVLDPAASNFQGSTITITELPSGDLQFTVIGESYTFRPDGQERPALFGATAAWKQIDPNTWEAVYRGGERILWIDTTKLSADGKSLTVISKVHKPDGGTKDDVVVYERVSGGPGLAGKYRATKANVTSVSTLEIAPRGENGLSLKMVDYNGICNPEFDGKDYPATGPLVAPGTTFAVRRTDTDGFELTSKIQGKTIAKSTYVVSKDGKTLTETGAAVATPEEKYTAVYRRP